MNYPDGFTQAMHDRIFGATEADERREELERADMQIVEACGFIVQSFQSEIEAGKSAFTDAEQMAKFHASKKVRMEALANLHAFIECGKVRAIVGEAIDHWRHDDTPIEDLPCEDFGAAMFDRLYNDISEGNYAEFYED